MSEPGPLGGSDPFEGMPPMFRDIAKLFAGSGPLNWEVARQMAAWSANEGQPEPNVDPVDRIRLEEVLRVAELHVAEKTGLATSVAGGLVRVNTMTRTEWSIETLESYRPLLEVLAQALSVTEQPEHTETDDAMGALMGNMAQLLNPTLLGLQSGIMVGHLARRAMGAYDLPIPRALSDEIVFVPSNLKAFSDDWSLPIDDLRLWICINELTHHAVLGVPHVRDRLMSLLKSFAGGFEPHAAAFEERLATIDPNDLEGLQDAFGDPEALLGAMQTPAQLHVLEQLTTLVAAVEGFVDYVMDDLGTRLIGSYISLAEALRRRRVEQSSGDRFVERLFGMQLGPAEYERGAAFVQGIAERAGDSGLARLWESERTLPTPAEITAPGLWLERIDLPASFD